ncbi:hypothetical protein MHF_0501 [Mycoplasma haemofelis Ohio2]|uniref:Uncharacterized protein n=1 Tax=Mycoplasma haemofelis (strain Ohio2) TaxID=859194 RepID=F6FHN4_MYCHI|nr:hypothetical protein MHF_0501 [Mycoplasma haemofelis Ohio2]
MSLTSTKAALGLGTVGVVGTGSYFAISGSSKQDNVPIKTKLSEQLIKDGFALLNFESSSTHSQEWTTVLGKYKTSNKDKFSGVTLLENGQDHESKNIGALKEACKSLIEKTEFSESYDKARRWCVVPKGVKDILLGLKKQVLKHGANEDVDLWKRKVAVYDHKDLPLAGITWPVSGEPEKISKLKEGCKALMEKDVKTYDEDFSADFKIAKRWCIGE